MDSVNGTTKIEVKLSTSGRYTWSIETVFSTEQGATTIKKIHDFDRMLKQEFPDYAKRGSGRIAAIDEE